MGYDEEEIRERERERETSAPTLRERKLYIQTHFFKH